MVAVRADSVMIQDWLADCLCNDPRMNPSVPVIDPDERGDNNVGNKHRGPDLVIQDGQELEQVGWDCWFSSSGC